MAASPRALVVAAWIFSVNCGFAIYNTLDPFHFAMPLLVDAAMINQTALAANATSVSGLGIAEAVMGINLFLQILVGPLTLVPTILSMIGVVGIINWCLTGVTWFIYIVFLVQLLSGRIFKVTL